MNKYWFRPKTYGYGFVPISFEGWIATLVLLALIFASAYSNHFFTNYVSPEEGIRFMLDVIIFASLFTALMKDKVKEGLAWRWGRK